MGPGVDTEGETSRPIDVQRTLQYQSHVFTRTLIWMPIVCLAIGLWVLLYGSVHDRLQWQPWLGLFLGIGWLIYAFVRLVIPAPPMLVLSPEGMIWRNGSSRLIPWHAVKDVTVIDHVITGYRGYTQTIENVTVVWVSRSFYNSRIFRSILIRGPFAGKAYVHKDNATGIVILHEMIGVSPQPLRQEIIARWQKFGSPGARTSVPSSDRPVELADHAEERTPQYWLIWIGIIGFPAIASLVVYLIGSAVNPPPERWFEQSERDQIAMRRKTEQMWEDAARERNESRLKWREDSPWMFAGDVSFTEVGSTPPQRPGSTKGHKGSVRSLDLSNDGRSLLSASADGTVKFWDLQKPQPLRDAGLHGGAASAVRFLPGGDRFVSAGGDGQVVVRAIEDGEVLHRFDGRAHGHVATLALSADGQRALAAYEKSALIVWDLQSKAMVKTLKDVQFYAVDISPDGRQAVIGTYEGKLFVWDIDGDASPREIGTQQGGVFAIAVTPDGKHFIAGGGGDCVLRLRDIATGDEVRAFAFHNAPITRLAVSADGKHVVSGSLDNTSRVWDVETGKPVTTLDQSNVVRAVAFAADGAILTAGDDRTIRLWSRRGFREREFPGVSAN
jgi:hypothetical protein